MSIPVTQKVNNAIVFAFMVVDGKTHVIANIGDIISSAYKNKTIPKIIKEPCGSIKDYEDLFTEIQERMKNARTN